MGEGGHVEGKGGNEVVASNSIRVARGLITAIQPSEELIMEVAELTKSDPLPLPPLMQCSSSVTVNLLNCSRVLGFPASFEMVEVEAVLESSSGKTGCANLPHGLRSDTV